MQEFPARNPDPSFSLLWCDVTGCGTLPLVITGSTHAEKAIFDTKEKKAIFIVKLHGCSLVQGSWEMNAYKDVFSPRKCNVLQPRPF